MLMASAITREANDPAKFNPTMNAPLTIWSRARTKRGRDFTSVARQGPDQTAVLADRGWTRFSETRMRVSERLAPPSAALQDADARSWRAATCLCGPNYRVAPVGI